MPTDEEPTDETLASIDMSRERWENLITNVHNGNRAEALITLAGIVSIHERKNLG